MKNRRLGRSGLMVSELCLGTMNFGGATDEAAAAGIIDAALEHGINFIDCANAYAEGRSEAIVGQALKRSGKRRQLVLASKAFLPTGDGPNECGNSRKNLIDSCMRSLERLQTDYLDVFFLHRTDWNVPQEETLSALRYLVDQGAIRNIACSTHPAWRTVEALHIADRKGYPKFICEEPPYNLLDRRIENEIVPMCQQYDLGIVTWSPLAQGTLAGRYQTAAEIPNDSRAAQKDIYAERITDQGIAVAGQVAQRANARGVSPAALSVAWVLHQPAVSSVIIGPRTIAHLEDLLSACEIDLSQADLDWFDTLVPPGGNVSDHFNTAGWRANDPDGLLSRWR